MTDADERACLAGSVGQLAAELEASLKRIEVAGVVSGVVDEEPAERVERRGELVSIAEIAPEIDPFGEERPPFVGIATPRCERTRRRE